MKFGLGHFLVTSALTISLGTRIGGTLRGEYLHDAAQVTHDSKERDDLNAAARFWENKVNYSVPFLNTYLHYNKETGSYTTVYGSSRFLDYRPDPAALIE